MGFYLALNENEFHRWMDEAGNNHSEEGNQDSERQMLNVLPHMWMLPVTL